MRESIIFWLILSRIMVDSRSAKWLLAYSRPPPSMTTERLEKKEISEPIMKRRGRDQEEEEEQQQNSYYNLLLSSGQKSSIATKHWDTSCLSRSLFIISIIIISFLFINFSINLIEAATKETKAKLESDQPANELLKNLDDHDPAHYRINKATSNGTATGLGQGNSDAMADQVVANNSLVASSSHEQTEPANQRATSVESLVATDGHNDETGAGQGKPTARNDDSDAAGIVINSVHSRKWARPNGHQVGQMMNYNNGSPGSLMEQHLRQQLRKQQHQQLMMGYQQSQNNNPNNNNNNYISQRPSAGRPLAASLVALHAPDRPPTSAGFNQAVPMRLAAHYGATNSQTYMSPTVGSQQPSQDFDWQPAAGGLTNTQFGGQSFAAWHRNRVSPSSYGNQATAAMANSMNLLLNDNASNPNRFTNQTHSGIQLQHQPGQQTSGYRTTIRDYDASSLIGAGAPYAHHQATDSGAASGGESNRHQHQQQHHPVSLIRDISLLEIQSAASRSQAADASHQRGWQSQQQAGVSDAGESNEPSLYRDQQEQQVSLWMQSMRDNHNGPIRSRSNFSSTTFQMNRPTKSANSPSESSLADRSTDYSSIIPVGGNAILFDGHMRAKTAPDTSGEPQSAPEAEAGSTLELAAGTVATISADAESLLQQQPANSRTNSKYSTEGMVANSINDTVVTEPINQGEQATGRGHVVPLNESDLIALGQKFDLDQSQPVARIKELKRLQGQQLRSQETSNATASSNPTGQAESLARVKRSPSHLDADNLATSKASATSHNSGWKLLSSFVQRTFGSILGRLSPSPKVTSIGGLDQMTPNGAANNLQKLPLKHHSSMVLDSSGSQAGGFSNGAHHPTSWMQFQLAHAGAPARPHSGVATGLSETQRQQLLAAASSFLAAAKLPTNLMTIATLPTIKGTGLLQQAANHFVPGSSIMSGNSGPNEPPSHFAPVESSSGSGGASLMLRQQQVNNGDTSFKQHANKKIIDSAIDLPASERRWNSRARRRRKRSVSVKPKQRIINPPIVYSNSELPAIEGIGSVTVNEESNGNEDQSSIMATDADERTETQEGSEGVGGFHQDESGLDAQSEPIENADPDEETSSIMLDDSIGGADSLSLEPRAASLPMKERVDLAAHENTDEDAASDGESQEEPDSASSRADNENELSGDLIASDHQLADASGPVDSTETDGQPEQLFFYAPESAFFGPIKSQLGFGSKKRAHQRKPEHFEVFFEPIHRQQPSKQKVQNSSQGGNQQQKQLQASPISAKGSPPSRRPPNLISIQQTRQQTRAPNQGLGAGMKAGVKSTLIPKPSIAINDDDTTNDNHHSPEKHAVKKSEMMSPLSSSFNVLDLDPSLTRLAHNKLIVARNKPKRVLGPLTIASSSKSSLPKPTISTTTTTTRKPISLVLNSSGPVSSSSSSLTRRSSEVSQQAATGVLALAPESRHQSDSSLADLRAALLGAQGINSNYVNDIINRWTRAHLSPSASSNHHQSHSNNSGSSTTTSNSNNQSHQQVVARPNGNSIQVSNNDKPEDSESSSTRSIANGINGLRLVSELMQPFASSLASRLSVSANHNPHRYNSHPPPSTTTTTSSSITTTTTTTTSTTSTTPSPSSSQVSGSTLAAASSPPTSSSGGSRTSSNINNEPFVQSIAYLPIGPIRQQQINTHKNDKFNFSLLSINSRERINPSLFPVEHPIYGGQFGTSSNASSNSLPTRRPANQRHRLTTARAQAGQRPPTPTSTSTNSVAQSGGSSMTHVNITSSSTSKPDSAASSYGSHLVTPAKLDPSSEEIGQILRSQHQSLGEYPSGRQSPGSKPSSWMTKAQFGSNTEASRVSSSFVDQRYDPSPDGTTNHYVKLDQQAQNANRYFTLLEPSSEYGVVVKNGGKLQPPNLLAPTEPEDEMDEQSIVIMNDNHHYKGNFLLNFKHPSSLSTNNNILIPSKETVSRPNMMRHIPSDGATSLDDNNNYNDLHYSSGKPVNLDTLDANTNIANTEQQANEQQQTTTPMSNEADQTELSLRPHAEEIFQGTRIRPSSVAKIIGMPQRPSAQSINTTNDITHEGLPESLHSTNENNNAYSRTQPSVIVLSTNHRYPAFANHSTAPWRSRGQSHRPSFINQSQTIQYNVTGGPSYDVKLDEFAKELMNDLFGQNQSGNNNGSMVKENRNQYASTEPVEVGGGQTIDNQSKNAAGATMDARDDNGDTSNRASMRRNQAKIQSIIASMAKRNRTQTTSTGASPLNNSDMSSSINENNANEISASANNGNPQHGTETPMVVASEKPNDSINIMETTHFYTPLTSTTVSAFESSYATSGSPLGLMSRYPTIETIGSSRQKIRKPHDGFDYSRYTTQSINSEPPAITTTMIPTQTTTTSSPIPSTSMIDFSETSASTSSSYSNPSSMRYDDISSLEPTIMTTTGLEEDQDSRREKIVTIAPNERPISSFIKPQLVTASISSPPRPINSQAQRPIIIRRKPSRPLKPPMKPIRVVGNKPVATLPNRITLSQAQHQHQSHKNNNLNNDNHDNADANSIINPSYEEINDIQSSESETEVPPTARPKRRRRPAAKPVATISISDDAPRPISIFTNTTSDQIGLIPGSGQPSQLDNNNDNNQLSNEFSSDMRPSRIKVPGNMIASRPNAAQGVGIIRKRPTYVRVPTNSIKYIDHPNKRPNKKPSHGGQGKPISSSDRPISIILPASSFINRKDQDIRTNPVTIVDPSPPATNPIDSTSESLQGSVGSDPIPAGAMSIQGDTSPSIEQLNPTNNKGQHHQTTIRHNKIVVSYKPGQQHKRPSSSNEQIFNERPQHIQIEPVNPSQLPADMDMFLNNSTPTLPHANFSRPNLGSGNGGETFLVPIDPESNQASTRRPMTTTLSLDGASGTGSYETSSSTATLTPSPPTASAVHRPIIVINGLLSQNQSHNNNHNNYNHHHSVHRVGKPHSNPNSAVESGSIAVLAQASGASPNAVRNQNNYTTTANPFSSTQSGSSPSGSSSSSSALGGGGAFEPSSNLGGESSSSSSSSLDSMGSSNSNLNQAFGSSTQAPSSGSYQNFNLQQQQAGSQTSSHLGMPFLGPGSTLTSNSGSGGGSSSGSNRPNSHRPYRWRIKRKPNGNHPGGSSSSELAGPGVAHLYGGPISNTIRRIFSLNTLATMYDNFLLAVARLRTFLISLMVMFFPPLFLAASVVNAVT